MSTTATPSDSEFAGFPELTSLGKQLEVLRIGRGISKQHLAHYAGTSRQQLWRVMTGKSELTETLRQRLATALGVHVAALATDFADVGAPTWTARGADFRMPDVPASPSLEDYLAAPDHAERTLQTLPNGEAGRGLKRTLLNALEDQAIQLGISLPAGFFDLRRRVLSSEL